MFMGTAPAPDLANDFAFMLELNFLKIMINRYLLDTRNNTILQWDPKGAPASVGLRKQLS